MDQPNNDDYKKDQRVSLVSIPNKRHSEPIKVIENTDLDTKERSDFETNYHNLKHDSVYLGEDDVLLNDHTTDMGKDNFRKPLLVLDLDNTLIKTFDSENAPDSYDFTVIHEYKLKDDDDNDHWMPSQYLSVQELYDPTICDTKESTSPTVIETISTTIKETFYVKARPHLLIFLSVAQEHYRIAVWSAGQSSYVRQVVEQIFSGIPLEFVWCADHCGIVSVPVIDPITNHISIEYHISKPISHILLAFDGRFSQRHILMLDDTKETYSENPENGVSISSWHGDSNDVSLLYATASLLKWKDMEDLTIIPCKSIYSTITSTLQPTTTASNTQSSTCDEECC